jgi:signal peptide peptidase SppA
MKYPRIFDYVRSTPWAILESKLGEIEAILQFHMEGGKFTADELRARLGDPGAAPTPVKQGAIAVIPLRGVISHRMGGMTEMSGGMSVERFSAMFDEALRDDSVSAIVADIDTPGGTISGLTEMWAKIYAARGQKKTVAQVNALCASAGQWLASAFEEKVCTPSGDVGSIGVITSHLDTSKAEEADGVKRTVVSAGKYKAEGQGPLTEEAQAALQARVDEAYAMMVRDIAKGYGVAPSVVREGFGEGRLVGAKEALKLGMIDRIDTMEGTIGRLLGRGGTRSALRAELPAGVAAESFTDDAGTLHVTIENNTNEAAPVDVAALITDADRLRRLERF